MLHSHLSPRASATTSGTRFGRAARASSSARARRFLRRSNRSASSSWTRNTSTLTSRRKPRATTRATWPSCAVRWKAPSSCSARPRRRWRAITIAEGQIRAAGIAGARGQPEDAARPRRGHAAGCGEKEKGAPDFLAATQGSHHATARKQRADDFVFEPARLFDFVAMSASAAYVAECPNCSLSLTYHRPEQKLRCHLCGHVEPVPRGLPRIRNAGNPAIRFPAPARRKSRRLLTKLVSARANQAHGCRRDEAQGRLPEACLVTFRAGQD